ncbi:phosphotransferase family protein [Rhodococcus jostii]|uniref:Phosphotransferase enzyme family protein n=1 Tax=Rhodococcus jostii TaxID=132919 RepID=A0A1H4RVH6_RHOJO|nr:phosphotransferase [Rhodococcus jostii]SEC35808.1 Phosphotransferase enzyme family protein [Rhodococcus jostii]
MTATLADPVSEVVAAAEKLLTRRTGAPVTLVDPVDLGGSGRTIVLRVRVAENPFSLPRTLVIKQLREESGVSGARAVDPDDLSGDSGSAFLREAVSYQFATALATDSRPGAELLASDLEARLLVLSDLGDATPISALLEHSDAETVTNTLMAMAQALGRMHAATVGREEDFTALLRRAEVAHCDDTVAEQVERAVPAVPRLLAEILGIDVSPELTEQVARAAKLFESGRFRAFSPSDLCPDNIIVNDEGVRFLDYEWGGFRDAMLDIAYALVSFPGCLCSIDLSDDRTQAMIEAWRAEVVGMWPALADDNVLAARMVEAQLIWVWLSTYLFLPENHTRIAAVREHHLSVPRSEALIQRWDRLARSADHAGNTVVAHHARTIADKIRGLSVG